MNKKHIFACVIEITNLLVVQGFFSDKSNIMGSTRFQSSLTKKYVMAFAGLFLISFLFVHMTINLLVLLPDTDLFNVAAHFMGTNIVIKVFEIVLFGGFIIHIIYGLVLQIQNWMARPTRYRIEGWSHSSPFSKFMIHTAVLIFIFLVIRSGEDDPEYTITAEEVKRTEELRNRQQTFAG